MTNPVCRDCGKECVWGKTQKGKPILMDLRLHFIGCKKRPRKGQVSASPDQGAVDDAVELLVGLGYKKREAREMVGEAKGDVAQIVTEALKGKE
jgi:Holliday junction resolvasome RuvABC DNA-binding subunit